MPSLRKGIRKPSIWMIFASWEYTTWQLGDGRVFTANTWFASSWFVKIGQTCVYYAEVLESDNLVILVSLVVRREKIEGLCNKGENSFVEWSTKSREILAAKHWVRPGDRWGLGCYSALLPSGFSRWVMAEAYGARCEDDAASELLMLACSAILCVHDTTSMFECPPLRQIDKLTYGAKNFGGCQEQFYQKRKKVAQGKYLKSSWQREGSREAGKRGVTHQQRIHMWKNSWSDI